MVKEYPGEDPFKKA